MDQIRVDTQGAASANLFGARAEAELPVHAPAFGSLTGEPARPRRSWPAVALRIVRDALIAVVLMTAVPIILVARNGDRVWDPNAFKQQPTRARVAQAEIARPLALSADRSITPMQAGLAFNALQEKIEVRGFPMNEPAERPIATWETQIVTPDMFRTAKPTVYKGPSSVTILEAVSKGFTPQEMAYLRELAGSPVWKHFDVVARAPAVDFVGGRFRVPFAPDATHFELPTLRYKGTRDLAYAAVSRAAYHMTMGQRDSAETVLRSIVSVGFALIDNGTSLIDELVGNQIVGIGRDALQRFYVITHDSRATSPAVQPPPPLSGPVGSRRGSTGGNPDEMRRRFIAIVDDPSTRRAERYDALNSLSVSSCTTVGQLLFGRSPDVDAAFSRARRNLARYPSEQSLVDLVDRPVDPVKLGNPFTGVAISAATVAGTVLHNPRFATCALVAQSVYRK